MLERGAIVGGYRIEGMLGRGGMGVVYEATQLSLDRRIALKALRPELAGDPDFVERFRREGRLQASFDHPHVIDVYEAFEADEGLFLAMRLESGVTLAELLRAGELDAARALRLLRQVADALDAAHAAGLVHRDVKPRNVLVGDDDEAFLADFGLTKAGDGTEVTGTGGMMGTIPYLAPEIIHGERAIPASDRYAFAAMLFECLSGEVVFPRASEAAVLYAHTNEPPPAISERRPELPRALDSVLATALAKVPGERPGSARALVDTVERAIGAERLQDLGPPEPSPTPASEPTPVTERTRPTRRRPALTLAAAGLAGAILGAAAVGVAASGDEDGSDLPAPPVPKRAQPLGSDLSASARTVDCRGRRPSRASPACSIAQAALPGRRFVVPADGAIFGWAVRGARGEIALQALRPRDGGAAQVARSQYETVNNGTPHYFATNLQVQRGDIIALEVTRGAGIGVSTTADATTNRWFPTRRGKPPEPPDKGPGTGLDREVLVRADYVPRAKARVPRQLTGSAAARARKGRSVARRSLTFTDGRRVRMELVELRDRLALDLFRGARRVARVDVPGFRPGGRLINMAPLNYDDSEAAGEVGVEWVNDNSARLREHYYGVYPRKFEFYD